jgi:hypothetical protein
VAEVEVLWKRGQVVVGRIGGEFLATCPEGPYAQIMREAGGRWRRERWEGVWEFDEADMPRLLAMLREHEPFSASPSRHPGRS